MTSRKVSERQLREALVDVDDPADKWTIVRHAERNGADEVVLKVLRGIPPVDYGNFGEVLSSVTTVEAVGEQSPSEKAQRARERHWTGVAEHVREIDEAGLGDR
jgi:hypothetical protein